MGDVLCPLRPRPLVAREALLEPFRAGGNSPELAGAGPGKREIASPMGELIERGLEQDSPLAGGEFQLAVVYQRRVRSSCNGERAVGQGALQPVFAGNRLP